MSQKKTDFISWFFIRFPWLAFFLLDNPLFRNNLFRKIILYRPELFETYFQWKPRWFSQKAIIIIKTDAIGDFMLFRKAIQAIKESQKYRNYKIYLLGNEVWKDLAISLDGNFVNGFFWLNRHACKNPADPFYRQQLVFDINKIRFEKLVYFSFSREHLSGDWLAGHISAKEKITTEGDLLCQTREEQHAGNSFFQKLFPLSNLITFELEKNKLFTEWLINEKIKSDFISINNPTPDISSDSNKIVFFPGASADFRQWPIESFIEIGKKILEIPDLKIVIAGGKEDENKGNQIVEILGSERVTSVCGKVSLPEFFQILANARMLISNETSGVHMAVALGIPTICISNGNHYGRFNPYEHFGFAFVKTIYPALVREKSEEERLLLWKDGSEISISNISSNEVWEEIKEWL